MSELRRLSCLIKETRPALFLGAGASVESGGRTGQEIALGILRKAYGTKSDDTIKKLFETEYNMYVSFENVLEAFGTCSEDRRALIIEFFNDMAPSEGYRYLAALVKAGYFYSVILTTNFDHMLEDAIKNDGYIGKTVSIKVIIAEDLQSSNLQPREDELIILKIHGDIVKPNSLKLTSLQTARISKDCERVITQICEQNGLIVVGYRAGDIGIRNAMQKAKSVAKGWYWVSKDILDESNSREALLLLEKHNSKKNVVTGVTFDEFFKELGFDMVTSQIREKNRVELDAAWKKLERARSFGKERKALLTELEQLSNQLVEKIDLEEVLALREFVQCEVDRSCGTYRMLKGVKFLEKSLERYNKYIPKKDLTSIDIMLLEELLNLFLSGDQVPGGRLEYLDKLVTRAEIVLKQLSRRDLVARNRTLIVITESLKEKAMVTSERDTQFKIFMDARKYGEEVITSLKDFIDPESKYLIGAAYRHVAITYELEGDLEDSEDQRRKCYEKWRQYSSKAVEVLEDIGEDDIRGYALMNLASGLTKQCNSEVKDLKKKQLLQASKEYLEDSIKCHTEVDDHRGIGWAYIHLCENLRQQASLYQSKPDYSSLLQLLENYGNKAVAELKRGEDNLAQGLAYEQLGIALYLTHTENKEDDVVKIEKAISALKESAKKLEATGFYRGCGEAFSWIGLCQFVLWKQTQKMDYLIASVYSLLQGITLTTEGLKTQNILEDIYNSMRDEIQKIL